MGRSIAAKLYVGIPLTDILNIETKETTFEIHCKKGLPTGKFETEKLIRFSHKNPLSTQKSFEIDISNVEFENIADYLSLHFEDDNKISIWTSIQYGDKIEENFKNIIIGFKVMSLDSDNSNEITEISEDVIQDFKNKIKEFFVGFWNETYGYTTKVSPKLFLEQYDNY